MHCHVCQYEYVTKNNTHFHCNECGHAYLVPHVEPTQYHAEEYRKKIQRTKGEFKSEKVTPLFHQTRQWIVDGRVEKIGKYLSKEDYVLDIGAGAGTFANRIKSLVKYIRCLELADILVDECKRLGFPTVQKSWFDFISKRRYDVVFAWHVLEHVVDITAFMQKAILYADKAVIIEVPITRGNTHLVPAKFMGHCHYFCDKSFKLFMEQFNKVCDVTIIPGVQKSAALAICQKKMPC